MKTKCGFALGRSLSVAVLFVCGALLSACAANPGATAPPVTAAAPAVQTAPPAAEQALQKQQPRSVKTTKNKAVSPILAADFDAWVTAFRARAIADGVAPATVVAAFADVALVPRVLELGNRQPEFSRRIWSYLDILVTPARVRIGRDKLATHAAIAAHTEREYGVPPAIIGAIWGVESSYGENFGDYDTVDALATLAFDGRRRDWAVRQLYAIFKIIDRGLIQPGALRGSWAGAMGHTQFIPTSYLAYAADGDGDSRIDIWGSIPDVMASTANYLAVHGWQAGSPWGVEVVLAPTFDYGQARLAVERSSRFWAQHGVRSADGQPLPAYAQASIIAPAGAHGPAFLVGPNFGVIMSYNHSISYALAVGLLANQLAGLPGVRGAWPRAMQAMSHDQIAGLQRLLNRAGFGVGGADGIIGPNTKAGIRAFQQAQGLVADGFATVPLLQQVRRVVGSL